MNAAKTCKLIVDDQGSLRNRAMNGYAMSERGLAKESFRLVADPSLASLVMGLETEAGATACLLRETSDHQIKDELPKTREFRASLIRHDVPPNGSAVALSPQSSTLQMPPSLWELHTMAPCSAVADITLL